MSKPILYFDIETGPADDTHLQRMEPEFEAPGNLKDPTKIAAAIAEKKQAWRDGAALDALTGQVLAFGVLGASNESHIVNGDELSIVSAGLAELRHHLMRNHYIAGWNIKGFDLPFLRKRAWVLGLPFPNIMGSRYRGRWYWNPNCLDMLEEWQSGSGERKGQSLGQVSKLLGGPEKLGKGADYYKLTPQQRVDYLQRDLEITAFVGKRMGLPWEELDHMPTV